MTRTLSGFNIYPRALDSAEMIKRLSVDLRGAVRNRELFLVYQPKLDIKTGRISGVEALMRWRHPKLGLLDPRRFIPMAEQLGIIGELDAWAIDESCRQLAVWRHNGEFSGSMAVNVSMLDLLEPRFVEVVGDALRSHRIEPTRLILEITETCAMADPARTLLALRCLAEIGVQVAMDDFGTGHSSLAHLRRLPVNEIKVDQSFIRDIENSCEDAAIVSAIVNLAEAIGMNVIAEGVETMGQLAVLVRVGCHAIQGYLVGRPMPPADLVRSLVDFETIIMK